MTRGMPAIWSTILGIPFALAGTWLYVAQAKYPSIIGVPFVLFGLFIVSVGVYVHVVGPSEPRLQNEETVLEIRHPTQRVALVKIGLGIPLLTVSVYIMSFTTLPYVYPTATFLIGLYTFSTGLQTYWTNTLTSYWITSNRIIKEYRLLSLIRQEIPHSKVRGVQERKSLTESLVGLGNVRVASGGGQSLEIIMPNMENSEGFADTIRRLH